MFNSLHLVMASVEPNMILKIWDRIADSNLINFIFVLAFMTWVVKKFKVLSAIDNKQNLIKQAVKTVEEEKVKAELELDATKKRLRKSDEELEKIAKNATEIAGSLSKKIIDEAHIQAQDLVKKNEKIIEAEKEMTANEVTHSISKAAFIVAEEHIKQSIDGRLHKKFIDEFIDKLTDLKV